MIRPAYAPLNERGLEVLQLAATGHTNAMIGRKLHLSEDTIKAHMRVVFRALDARDRAHAVHLAHQQGLLR